MADSPIAARVLVPAHPDDLTRKIRAWREVDDIAPDELRAWLERTAEMYKQTVVYIHTNIEGIRTLDERDRWELFYLRENSIDFVDRAGVALQLLEGVTQGRVSKAFLEGLRCGLLFEKMLSLVDGRYRDHLVKQEGRQRGAKTTNEAHAELRQKYQPAIDRVMEQKKCSFSKALPDVAHEFGVSESTIKKYTKNPKPRNRGRHQGSQPL